MDDYAGVDRVEELNQPIGFFVQILFTHKMLRDLGARDLGFELVHQITHGLAACLAVDQSPVIDQPAPMIERILVDCTTSPSPSASDSSNEV